MLDFLLEIVWIHRILKTFYKTRLGQIHIHLLHSLTYLLEFFVLLANSPQNKRASPFLFPLIFIISQVRYFLNKN